MASSFAVLLSLTALGFVLFKAAEFVDSRIVFWNHDDRLAAVGRKRAAAWKAGIGDERHRRSHAGHREERRRRRSRSGASLTLAIFVVVIGTWELLGAMGQLNDLILPAPSAIGYAIVELCFVTGRIWWHFFVTMFEALAGFAIGAGIGVMLAIAAGLNPTFRRYIAPYVVVVQVTPLIAVAPLMIAWFGFGWSSKIAIAALVCFFAPFVNTLTGLLNVDPDAEEMFRSLGATKRQVFWKLMLPSSFPIIIAGLKTAMALALIGAVVGEFISASEGSAFSCSGLPSPSISPDRSPCSSPWR